MSCFLIPNQVKSLFPFVLIASVKGTQYDQRNRTLFEQFKLFLLAWEFNNGNCRSVNFFYKN